MWNKSTVKSIYWWIKYVKNIDSGYTEVGSESMVVTLFNT